MILGLGEVLFLSGGEWNTRIDAGGRFSVGAMKVLSGEILSGKLFERLDVADTKISVGGFILDIPVKGGRALFVDGLEKTFIAGMDGRRVAVVIVVFWKKFPA